MNPTETQFSIKLSNGLQLERNLKEKEAESAASNKQDMRTGYIWYTLHEEEIKGTKVVFNLFYYLDTLESIRLTLSDEKYGKSWDDWSQKKEQERAKDTEQFLTDLGYPPKKYEWGEVWGTFDSKGGSGGVTFSV